MDFGIPMVSVDLGYLKRDMKFADVWFAIGLDQLVMGTEGSHGYGWEKQWKIAPQVASI